MLALTFLVGNDRLALDIRRITEVVPRVTLHRPADGPDWLAGVFVYRGAIVPVIDLHRLMDLGDCPAQLSSRIIMVPRVDGRESWLGLLATGVLELREMEPAQERQLDADDASRPDLGAMRNEEGEILRMVDVQSLLPAAVRQFLERECMA